MHSIRIRTVLAGKDLHKALDSMDAVAVSPEAAGSVSELMLAGHLARRAFERGGNIARSLRYEFLLWLSGKRDIRSAMEATAPGDGEMIVIVFGEGKDAAALLHGTQLPLGLPEDGEPLALERISLSRVKG